MTSVVTYTVHEPAAASADRADRAEQLEFVRDGFSWLTAVCPPIGLAAKGMWLPAILYVALVSAVIGIASAAGINDQIVSIVLLGFNVYLGFEVSSVQRFMLDSRGYEMIGSVSGRSIEECERRFFESWLPDQPMVSVSKPRVSDPVATGLWRYLSKF